MEGVVWRWGVVSFGSESVPMVGSNITAREFLSSMLTVKFWRTAFFCGIRGANTKHVSRGILLTSAHSALQIVVISGILNNHSSTSYEHTERPDGLSRGNLLTVTCSVYANSVPVLAERLVLHVAMWPLERGVVENLVGWISGVTTQSGRVASAEGIDCLTDNTRTIIAVRKYT